MPEIEISTKDDKKGRGFVQAILDSIMRDEVKFGPKGKPRGTYLGAKKTRGGQTKAGSEAWDALAMAEEME
jgi:hypothetical protein